MFSSSNVILAPLTLSVAIHRLHGQPSLPRFAGQITVPRHPLAIVVTSTLAISSNAIHPEVELWLRMSAMLWS